MKEKHKRIADFLKKYLLIILILPVATGVIANYVFDSLKSSTPSQMPPSKTRELFLDPSFYNKDSGTFIDERDGNKYKWVRIGKQIWMAENLAYHPKSSDGFFDYQYWENVKNQNLNNKWYCIAKQGDIKSYGILYTWQSIMSGPHSRGNAGVCPKGWHVPADNEWKELELTLGMLQNEADKIYYRGTDEGYKIKSKIGWANNGNGIDIIGFNAFPAGYRHFNDGKYYNLGNYAVFWTSTDVSEAKAWVRYLSFEKNKIDRYYDDKKNAFSLRCIRN